MKVSLRLQKNKGLLLGTLVVTGFGVLLILASLLVDLFSLGTGPGFGVRQIIGMAVGLLAVGSYWMYRALTGHLTRQDMAYLVLLGTGLGLVLVLACLLAIVVDPSRYSFGLQHNQVAIVGLSVTVCCYWAYRWLIHTLVWHDIPIAVVTAAVLLGAPILFMLTVDRFESMETTLRSSSHTLSDLDQRLLVAAATSNHAWRRLLRCTPSAASAVSVKLVPIVDGLSKPVYVTHAHDSSGRLFIVEKAGIIRIVQDGVLLPEPFLDIRSRVMWDESHPSGTAEQGLLSVAFHPDYAQNGRLFVYYTALPDGRTIVAEYRATTAPNLAESRHERVILAIVQPSPWHNGGQVQFGPDGFLYIGTGDGSGAGDAFANAQNLGTLLGKLLRIDVNREVPYAIPPDNPFVGQTGVRPEIFAYGLRNPWRFSFDRCDGSLFVGDVGEHGWEEIDHVIKGGNYGWPIMEGFHCFGPTSGCPRAGLQAPLTAYGHLHLDERGGNAIVGGYVYRGQRFPALLGRYFFADFMSKRLWTLTEVDSRPPRWERQEVLQLDALVSSFGEAEDGELYVLDYVGRLYQLTHGVSPQASVQDRRPR